MVKLVSKMKFGEDKNLLVYQLRELIYQAAVKVLGKRVVKFEDVILEHPALPDYGDYSSNIALVHLRGGTGRPPWELANAIVNAIREGGLPEEIAKIEVAKSGFINICLTDEYFISQLSEVLKKKEKFGTSQILRDKKILLEHTSPNPQTTIMLGHLRNNFLGMASARILEALGVKVTKDCVINDRGTHICRACWGYLFFADKKSGLTKAQLKNFRQITSKQIRQVIAKKNWREFLEKWQKNKSGWLTYKDLKLKPDHANLVWYVLGSQAYELSEKVKKQVEEMLVAWEKEEKGIRQLWQRLLNWSATGYAQTYRRVGSVHDWVWHESEHYQLGKEIVEAGLKKGIFRQSEGVVITNLEKYGLTDTVLIKSDGTALYITQDLALTKLKCQKFPADFYIWCIGEEQNLYFRQLFAICEQLRIAPREKLFHLSYALINFKTGGKMATRRGDVVMADEILDELEKRAGEIIKNSNQELRGKMTKNQLEKLVKKVAVGALKYSLLRFARNTTIYFDPEESLALEGNSGPYLQYTYARTQSVLKKSKIPNSKFQISTKFKIQNFKLNEEEMVILRMIYKFPEVILESGKDFAPSVICNYLFELAQKFNLFYNKWSIINASSPETRGFRLALTTAVGQVIKNGLSLLGIEVPERM